MVNTCHHVFVNLTECVKEKYPVSVKVSVAMVKHHNQDNLGKRGFISSYTSRQQSSSRKVRKRTQTGLKLEAGAAAEATEESCFLACSP